MANIPLGDALHRLMHAYKHLLREGVRAQNLDLPVTHIRALKGICRTPHSTAQSIAQRMQRDKAQITRALNDLIDARLIVKVDNLLDRRSQLLEPTPKGRKVMAKLDAVEDWAVEQMTVNLEVEDLAFFIRISNAMADGVEEMAKASTGDH